MTAIPMPVRYSPRPLRAAAHKLAPVVLAVVYRLIVAVAIAATVAFALVFCPQSVLLALTVVTLASGLVLTGREQATR